MAKLQAKDKVAWRAGASPSTTHVRTGVLKEILPDGTCMVRTRVEGAYRIEQIRLSRISKVEEPKKATGKKAKKGKKRASGKKKKKAAKKKAEA
ncbi:unnamed protein product [marine sediment metagenome]|uniref:Hypervirulence associated protein TUDOR domain-containing protein n=1 Tax=marine sediment metagenome TaxID=412755 RepID=X0SZ44_9ZZZZ